MSEQLADALRFVAQQAESATKKNVTIIDLAKAGVEPDGHYLLQHADGTLKQCFRSPKPPAHRFLTAEDLLAFISQESLDSVNGAAVFVGEVQIVLAPNHEDPRERHTVLLTYTEQFLALQELSGRGRNFNQKELISFLRIAMHGALGQSGLVSLLRELRFTNHQGGEGNIQHGEESLGRSVLAKVTGIDAIPDEVTFYVPVYEGLPTARSVACALEILVAEQAFRLTPYPGALAEARRQAVSELVELMATNKPGLPVYQGDL